MSEIIGFVKELINTPIGLVLVFAGIFFCFIGMVGKIDYPWITINLTSKTIKIGPLKSIPIQNIIYFMGVLFIVLGVIFSYRFSEISNYTLELYVILIIFGIIVLFIGIVGEFGGKFFSISLTPKKQIACVIISICLIISLLWFASQSIPIDINGSIRTNDNNGSSLNVTTIYRDNVNTAEISYSLKEFGWVSMINKIDPKELSIRKKIRISYNGTGKPNTIELKMVYGNMQRTTFGVFLPRATVTQGLVTKEISFDQFNCWWPEDNCKSMNGSLDVTKVIEIELAISNKAFDEPGDGKITIEDYVIAP